MDWRSVARGALIGFAIIVPVTIVQAILRHDLADYDQSGWRYPLFALILIAYLAAGWFGARNHLDEPFTYGSLAAVGALALWIPTRIVIWAVRENDRGLFTGTKAALRPGQVFGQLVIAAGLGMVGGWALSYRDRRRAGAPPVEP
jgi:ABC-type Fe3+-siderophore transport system permease subunit